MYRLTGRYPPIGHSTRQLTLTLALILTLNPDLSLFCREITSFPNSK